jgi:NAD(P)-dependent dehydrogenase (short-subunit alcohol dehydrogenase family)
VASIAGSTAFATGSIYSATKAAVISLGRTLAVEFAQRGVRVNVLSPGPIDTPIAKKTGLPPDQGKGVVEMLVVRSLLKRIGTSEEVAGLQDSYSRGFEQHYRHGVDHRNYQLR